MNGLSIIDAARGAVAIEDLAAAEVKLRKSGMEMRGACPFCGAGQKSASPPFAIKLQKGTFRCYCGCPYFGDVVDLERALRGGTIAEAARRLAGGSYVGQSRPKPVKAPDAGPSSSDRTAAELWKSAAPTIRGTLAERYLRNRGIEGPALDAVLSAPGLRFHPSAKWGWDEARGGWLTLPAMLAQVVTVSGPTGGVHATYLSRDARKAPVTPAKRMWGAQHDADGRPGGAWLIGPDGEGDLVIAEGIETTLSVAVLSSRRGKLLRACAALSLDRLQGGVLRDSDGCIDPFDPMPDPERGPFVWPTPVERPWRRVLVAVDRDMSPLKVKAKTPRGRVLFYQLEAEARARLCGRLATAAWLRAGAPAVSAIAPPPGFDFNNELQRIVRGSA